MNADRLYLSKHPCNEATLKPEQIVTVVDRILERKDTFAEHPGQSITTLVLMGILIIYFGENMLSCVICHISYIIYHISYIIYHISYIIYNI